MIEFPTPPRRWPEPYRPRHARPARPLIIRGERVLAVAYLIVATLAGIGLALAQAGATI